MSLAWTLRIFPQPNPNRRLPSLVTVRKLAINLSKTHAMQL